MTQGETATYCSQCTHPFGPHVVFPLGEHARDGGVAVCNVSGCSCVTTWSLDDQPVPTLPDPETVARLIRFAQGVRRDWLSA